MYVASLQTTPSLGDNYAIELIVRLVGIMVRLLVSGNIESYSNCDEIFKLHTEGKVILVQAWQY